MTLYEKIKTLSEEEMAQFCVGLIVSFNKIENLDERVLESMYEEALKNLREES